MVAIVVPPVGLSLLIPRLLDLIIASHRRRRRDRKKHKLKAGWFTPIHELQLTRMCCGKSSIWLGTD